MLDTQKQILDLLKVNPLKPSLIAGKLGISRQGLHRHLKVLLEKQMIEKRGLGSHVQYVQISFPLQTRINEDYIFCKNNILPRYREKFGDLPILSVKKSALDFSYIIDMAAVYSSNIEGNSMNIDSFLNSQNAAKKHRPKEAKEIEDLIKSYEFAQNNMLSQANFLKAHSMLSEDFVSKTRRGVYREEPVGVFSQRGLEYMAIEAHLLSTEMDNLFSVIKEIIKTEQRSIERLFWATWIHLSIALIHPFSDGNGRIARLAEKWFLAETLGVELFMFRSEHCYWEQRLEYYSSLKLGVNYWETDFKKAEGFFNLLPCLLK